MSKLTKDQIKKLYAAINSAREPGGCKYVSDGVPCCVIAQLATLEGVPLETLERWNSTEDILDGQDSITELYAKQQPATGMLNEKYGIVFLRDLQDIWDNVASTVRGGRAAMRKRVQAAIG